MKTNPTTNPSPRTPSNTAPHTQHVHRVPTVVLLFLSLASLGLFSACEEVQDSLNSLQYTCTNGTAASGSTTSDQTENCDKCNNGYKLLADSTCAPTEYICEHGIAVSGKPEGNHDVAECVECDNSYKLVGTECLPTKHTCKHGTPVTGPSAGNQDTEKCASCNSGYVSVQNVCVPANKYYCINGSPADGVPPNNIPDEKCELCKPTHYLAGEKCLLKYTCSNGTPVQGGPGGNTSVEKCATCNGSYELVAEYCFVNNNFHPTIIENLCNPESGFVPTSYNSSGVPTDASPDFIALSPIQQLECFTHAYPRENLPTKPTTTAAHRNTLPSGMLYAHSKYELIFEDTFNQPDTSTQVTSANPYDYTKVLDSTKWRVHVGGRSPYPTKATAINKEHNWPVLIKDHKFYLGNPRVKATEAPHEYYGLECSYDEEREAYYIDGKWRKGSCECDETRADYCASFGVTANLLAANGDHLKWRYGYLEIDVEQLFTGEHAWVCCTRALGQIEIRRGNYPIQEWWNAQPQFSGAVPNFFNTISAAHKELVHFGVEFQIFEKFAWSNHNGASAWLVLHYNDAQRSANLPKGRFYHTTTYKKGQLDRKVKRKYGIEWTPKGYKIWYNDTAWQNGITIQVFDPYDGNKTHSFFHDGACDSAKKLDSDGFLQCGVSHALQDFLIRTDAFSIPTRVDNPYYIINSVRLWKPKNNYADITPVYR